MIVDAIITGGVLGAAIVGYRRGAIIGLLGWGAVALVLTAGLLAGAAFGRFTLVMTVVVLGVVLLAAFGRYHGRVDAWLDDVLDAHRQFDRAFGTVIYAAGALSIAWLASAIVSLTPQESGFATAVRQSAIMRSLVGVVSPSGNFATMVFRSGIVPALDGPLVLADTPQWDAVDNPHVKRAAHSVVRIEGTTCGGVASGTGWVVAPQLIATNAHVIAGHERTRVTTDVRQRGVEATPVAFDPHNDLALLYLPTMTLPALQRRADLPHNAPLAVIGFPKRSRMSITPATFDRLAEFDVQDIYERRAAPATLMVFRGTVFDGNSGSPIVSADGAVVGTVTSSSVGQAVDGGYGASNDALERLLQSAGTTRVSTGRCLPEGQK